MKHPKRGRPPAIKHPGYHTVYLDRETWKWLMKQEGGASQAIRNLVVVQKETNRLAAKWEHAAKAKASCRAASCLSDNVEENDE